MALTCLRWLIALAALAALAGPQIRAEAPTLLPHWRYVVLMGAFGYTAFNALFYVSAHHTTGVNMAIIQGGMPALVLLGGLAAFGTRIGALQILGLVVTLVGVALVALVPEALSELPARPAMLTMAAGILTFFVLEKAVIWRHCHDDEACHVHNTAASLVIVGDAFHTFVDGAVIAAAVLTSVPLGITTAIAVAAHEVPQELGDVAILLRAGYSRGRALSLNLLSATGGVLGALLMLLASQLVPNALPYVLSFAAGSFLYVAMSDLIPDLHRGGIEGGAVRQLGLIGAGIATMALL
jgi:zinc and cadmium transporter